MENDVMSDLMRLDRFLVLTGAAKSRSDAKKILKTFDEAFGIDFQTAYDAWRTWIIQTYPA